MKLFVAGVSHKTAPVEVREQLAVKQSEIVDLARYLKCFGHLDEIVLLSTCNRVEIYGTTRRATGHIKSLLHLLCAEPSDLDPHIYLYEGAAAARHLFRVAAGLDSMVLGAGEMAESCVRLLVKKGARSIFISSRSFDRALDLATRCGGEAVCFGYCLFEMRDVDVVIAATSSAETLLSCDDIENLMKARRNRPLLLIDLAVPRNVDPAVRGLEHVALYNIDDLEGLARRGVQARERELAACHQIIEEHVAALIEKLNAEDERLSAEERNNRWVPDPLATPSNLLPTAA